MPNSKACTKCREAKPLENFYLNKRQNGEMARHSVCATCRRAQFKAWAKTDRGKASKRAGIMRREYGISEADYLAMFANQRGLCAICMKAESKIHHAGTPLRLSVDHDHATGFPRALLCSLCNVGLGAFRDDPKLLTAAAAYIRTQRARDNTIAGVAA